MIKEENLQILAHALGERARQDTSRLITAQSCSAGRLAPDRFEGGLVTCKKARKSAAPDISPAALAAITAVDGEDAARVVRRTQASGGRRGHEQ